jgi:hypothetical protein
MLLESRGRGRRQKTGTSRLQKNNPRGLVPRFTRQTLWNFVLSRVACAVEAGLYPLRHCPPGHNGRGSPRDPFHRDLRRICIRRMRAIPARESYSSQHAFRESDSARNLCQFAHFRVPAEGHSGLPSSEDLSWKFAIMKQSPGQDGLLRTRSGGSGGRRLFPYQFFQAYTGNHRGGRRTHRFERVRSA